MFVDELGEWLLAGDKRLAIVDIGKEENLIGVLFDATADSRAAVLLLELLEHTLELVFFVLVSTKDFSQVRFTALHHDSSFVKVDLG